MSWIPSAATSGDSVAGPAPPLPRLPAGTLTQEIAERRVQHPQEQQELSELSLHCLLTLLEVPVLREGWPHEEPDPHPLRGPVSRLPRASPRAP